MAQAAARLADHVVVTSDNPRSEDPHAIIEQILAGIPGRPAEAIEDRQVAIFSAIHRARPGDVILLAGPLELDLAAHQVVDHQLAFAGNF